MTDRPGDRIHIRDLRVRCILGVNPDERVHPQEVVIQLTLHADLRPAGRSDRLEDTVDYKAVKKRVLELAEQSRFLLVERMAQRIAELCLESPRVRAVRVVVEKPGALRFARTVGVEIFRTREDA